VKFGYIQIVLSPRDIRVKNAHYLAIPEKRHPLFHFNHINLNLQFASMELIHRMNSAELKKGCQLTKNQWHGLCRNQRLLMNLEDSSQIEPNSVPILMQIQTIFELEEK
jgi:hypothetical protein